MSSAPEIPKNIAVIIPCHNAVETLAEAVQSALQQAAVSRVWIVDDASNDGSLAVAQNLVHQFPERVELLRMPTNSGAAMARNWGVLHAREPLVAFLDADDVYRPQALDAAALAFQFIPQLAVVRLALHPWGLPERYTAHEGFARAWRSVEMTGAGNLVMTRQVFLSAGGFPQDALFKQFGGEDAALGLALHASVMVGTLFDQMGVQYRYKTGSHSQRLLDAHLFGQVPAGLSPAHVQEADAVTERIVQALAQTRDVLGDGVGKVVPLLVESKIE